MIRDADVGLVGLGVMGRNLALNFADKGFGVAGYDTDSTKVEALNKKSAGRKVEGFGSMKDLASALKKPRAIMMLVPAGNPVDAVIRDALPHVQPGDLMIDAGNSHFGDTNRRTDQVAEKGIHFLGVGVSGGEEGARHGPSMMPGGSEKAYERVRPLFEAAAAHVNGEPCVAYLGPGSAGHYVKMVHNGIEYGIMQLIAETYDVMKRLLRFDDDRLHRVYAAWNDGELECFLIQITSAIFVQRDEKTSGRLIDQILDEAKQKGTGKWTSQDAMDLRVPVPTIDTAVAMRNLSAYQDQRQFGEKTLSGPSPEFKSEPGDLVEDLRNALYAGMIIAYAQGMALLGAASKQYKYGVHLNDVARIWRGGCIIRARVLEEIRAAYQRQHNLSNLMFDERLGGILVQRQESLRSVIRTAVTAGIPVPALAASMGYFDAFKSSWLPANLIQAQRDYFGSHTYERIDERGVFHTEWGRT
jgi:6-phosphogluconate dehydrogenase